MINLFKGVNAIDFGKHFKDNETCMAYLATLKWQEGYVCVKCSHTEYSKGNLPHFRRCKGCDYDESPTANTLFHKLKFDIVKAFHIVFRVTVKKKSMSTAELAKEVGVTQKTAWIFKRKLQQAMKSSEQFPLTNEVHMDEFVLGQKEEGKPGRSLGKKKIAALVIEIKPNGKVGRAYAKHVNNYQTETLKDVAKKHVDKDAQLVSDKYKSYDSFSEQYPKHKSVKSVPGKNFIEIHNHIMNLKSWIRGIHHSVSDDHFQNYLDEFHYRFNRRNSTTTIFNNLINRIVSHNPFTFKDIKGIVT